MSADAASATKDASYYANARPDIVRRCRGRGARARRRLRRGNVGALAARGGRDARRRRSRSSARAGRARPRAARPRRRRRRSSRRSTSSATSASTRSSASTCSSTSSTPRRCCARLRDVAAPGARLQVSVPNARHFSLVWDLVVHGTFGYTECGHRDSTHLRWFTRRDIVAAGRGRGLARRARSHPALGRTEALDRLTRGRSTEFTGRAVVRARAAGDAPPRDERPRRARRRAARARRQPVGPAAVGGAGRRLRRRRCSCRTTTSTTSARCAAAAVPGARRSAGGCRGGRRAALATRAVGERYLGLERRCCAAPTSSTPPSWATGSRGRRRG